MNVLLVHFAVINLKSNDEMRKIIITYMYTRKHTDPSTFKNMLLLVSPGPAINGQTK